MAGKTKIALENIKLMQKLLRSLPIKDTRKSLEAAMEILDDDLRKALEKKGYSLKEIQAILKEGHIPISVSMLKKKLVDEQKNPLQFPLKKIAAVELKTEPFSAEGITIKPDTPDEEL